MIAAALATADPALTGKFGKRRGPAAGERVGCWQHKQILVASQRGDVVVRGSGSRIVREADHEIRVARIEQGDRVVGLCLDEAHLDAGVVAGELRERSGEATRAE